VTHDSALHRHCSSSVFALCEEVDNILNVITSRSLAVPLGLDLLSLWTNDPSAAEAEKSRPIAQWKGLPSLPLEPEDLDEWVVLVPRIDQVRRSDRLSLLLSFLSLIFPLCCTYPCLSPR
jgi:hypothetical protein